MQESEKCDLVRLEGASTGSINVSRRGVMKGLALAAMAGGLGRTAIAEAATTPAATGYPRVSPATGDTIKATDSNPVVKTQYGRVRGYIRNGINTFKGIPYGADTSGANRFMPPKKPEPWDHVMSCNVPRLCLAARPPRRLGVQRGAWLFAGTTAFKVRIVSTSMSGHRHWTTASARSWSGSMAEDSWLALPPNCPPTTVRIWPSAVSYWSASRTA